MKDAHGEAIESLEIEQTVSNPSSESSCASFGISNRSDNTFAYYLDIN
jgi:hypothetical protein